MTLDADLLELLACPLSKAPLVEVEDEAGVWLVSTDEATRRRYAVRDGLPILLIDESEELELDAWRSIIDGARS